MRADQEYSWSKKEWHLMTFFTSLLLSGLEVVSCQELLFEMMVKVVFPGASAIFVFTE